MINKDYWGKPTGSEMGGDEKKKIPVASAGGGDRVEILGTKIFYYSAIEQDKILDLNKHLHELSNKIIMRNMESTLGKNSFIDTPILLHIKSYGGSVFAGLAAMDTIQEIQKRVPIHTIVEGCSASAGTFLSVVGTKRYMRKNAWMLIHQLSSGLWGKYAEIKDEVENLDRLMDTIKRIYKEHTKVPMKELDGILKRDIWWDAQTCLKYGLIDEII
jgi:ATP-dependent Clp endopeptidase proteolytic subunit ClpP